MLDITLLDDKSYTALMEDAIDSLPRLTPDWTDYNVHDPGITFLELFAWLTEMQRYYIQQTTKRHILGYLKLLGITPRPASPAVLTAEIDCGDEDILLHAGAYADIGGIPYTLPEDTLLSGAEIRICMKPDEESFPPYGVLPFGETPCQGDIFYLHLSSALTSGKTYRIYTCVSPREGRIPMGDGFFTQADISAEVLSVLGWLSCDISDGTYGLSQNGFITLGIPDYFPPFSGRQLIRVTLKRCDIEEAPMFFHLSMCAVTLFQYESVAGNMELAVADDKTVPLPLEGRSVSHITAETAENGLWYKLCQVDNLYCHMSDKHCFELDEKNSCLRFGEIPPETITLRKLHLTLGLRGRVKENLSFRVTDGGTEYDAGNIFPSEGGFNSETVDDALRRYKETCNDTCRAVTREDYMRILAKTPGLRLKSAAIFEPEPGKVNVCVKTHSGRLTEPVKRNIRKCLGISRLCCTELLILEPEYWRAQLFIDLKLNKWAYGKTESLRSRIEEIILPFQDKFGLIISLSEWRNLIIKIPHVSQVTDLLLQGIDGRQTRPGETLRLPQGGLLRITGLVINDIC